MLNGVPDGTTARVVQLVLSSGQVWRENADGLWWSKSSPSGSWHPPLITGSDGSRTIPIASHVS